MFDYWLDVFLCAGITLLEFIGVMGIALLIQLISYQCFGINLYQKLFKGLNRLDKYLSTKF